MATSVLTVGASFGFLRLCSHQKHFLLFGGQLRFSFLLILRLLGSYRRLITVSLVSLFLVFHLFAGLLIFLVTAALWRDVGADHLL